MCQMIVGIVIHILDENKSSCGKVGQVAVNKGADVDHLEKSCVSKI